MHNVQVVHRLQSANHLYEYLPDFLLRKARFVFLMVRNLLEQVPVIRVLHYNARTFLYTNWEPYQSDCV
jgi:hypothetical protein